MGARVGVVVFGRPGLSARQNNGSEWSGTSRARRGAFFEERVAQALHQWLTRRTDTVHVFHDLVALNNITGAGLKPCSLGNSNIDHLVLAGDTWFMLDAKGCGAGSLRVEEGAGVLVASDGRRTPQPWMDERTAYSRAGVPYRLTNGKGGVAIWVLPSHTAFDEPSVLNAKFLTTGGRMTVLHDTELAAGALDELLPAPALPADPRDIDRLRGHVSAPEIHYQLPLPMGG